MFSRTLASVPNGEKLLFDFKANSSGVALHCFVTATEQMDLEPLPTDNPSETAIVCCSRFASAKIDHRFDDGYFDMIRTKEE